MVLAYHIIFCAYGFWLPNDPRGSWSDFVGAWELLRFGPATKTNTRRSVAGASHDWASRRAAKGALKYPPVSFDGMPARAVGRGFSLCKNITILACSIMPEHVHLVIGRCAYPVETAVNQLKGRATKQLRAERICPASDCWARGQWKVFLNSQRDIGRAIKYVEDNPAKEGLPPQRWSFVV
jgi:REP element-mobilizing transposase RayT